MPAPLSGLLDPPHGIFQTSMSWGLSPVFSTSGLYPLTPPSLLLVLGLTAQGQILPLPSSPGKRLGSGGCSCSTVTVPRQVVSSLGLLTRKWGGGGGSKGVGRGDRLRKVPSLLIQLGSKRLSGLPSSSGDWLLYNLLWGLLLSDGPGGCGCHYGCGVMQLPVGN